MTQPIYVVVLGGLVSLVLALRLFFHGHSTSNRLPLPPGPKRLPLVGNLLNYPKTLEAQTYHRWSKELKSDIIYLNVAGTSLIVLDTLEAASDLLDKRSFNYSSRPHMPMVIDLMGYGFLVPFMQYGEQWRQHRRLIHQALGPSASYLTRPPTVKAARRSLKLFLDKPDDIMGNLKYMAGEVIISVAYGLDVKQANDPYIDLAEKGNVGPTESAMPGSFLVDVIPILKYVPAWVPGAGFQKKAMEWKALGRAMLEIPFEVTKSNMKEGKCRPCMTSICLEEMEHGTSDEAYTEDNIRNAVGTLYMVGADTTMAAMGSCILGLLHNPQVVKRAQQDLDSVIKAGHLPEFSDQSSLPYITAITMEALRWNDVAPIGVPHIIKAEDEYKGYRLPAGSIVIANSWAILHDEEAYPDPFVFNPDRFMKGDELDPDIRDPSVACWGFGRRMCPGRYMAFSTIWIMIASLLTVYDVRNKVDDDGNIIEPGNEYLRRILCTPKPFVGSITPRSKEAESLIRASSSQVDVTCP